MTKNIYTFYMPGEERIFFNYFHTITFAFPPLFSNEALAALRSCLLAFVLPFLLPRRDSAEKQA